MLKFFTISNMPFSFFPTLLTSNIHFKYDQIINQTKAQFLTFPCLSIITLLFSFSLYAVSSLLDPLFCLLTCFTLILSTLAFIFLKTSVFMGKKEKEKEQEEDSVDDCSCDDSLLSTTSYEETTSAGEETDESEWTFESDPNPTLECSDGSISDEESLIELDPKKPFLPTRCGVPQQKYWIHCYYSMEPFQRQHLADLLAEIYEEENMIEIDLAIGSIKCPRLEIRA